SAQLYRKVFHLNQKVWYVCSFANSFPFRNSHRFQIKATVIVNKIAVTKRMTNNGHTGMPNGINMTVSSTTAWQETRKIKAKYISRRETPSSSTAWIINPAPNAKPIV